MKQTRFIKCRKCTKSKRRLAIPKGQREDYLCTPCRGGGKRNRRKK